MENLITHLKEHGWVNLPDLLNEMDLVKIKSVFDVAEFTPAMVGKINRLRVESIRGDFISWIDLLNPPEELQRIFIFLDELKQELNRNFLLGIKEYECHLAKYPEGTHYQKHVDRFEKDSTRVFTFVFYVNGQWGKDDGGELILYDKEGSVIQVICPRPGTFVGFFSEDFPHEVKYSKVERKSVTGWMHTKIIY